MNTYLSMTREEYLSLYRYDTEEGNLYKITTGQKISSLTPSGLIIKLRKEKTVVTISVGKLCYFLLHDQKIDKYDKIRYADGDYTNLKPDNLSLVRNVRHDQQNRREPVVQVDECIFYNPNSDLFVVRRDSKQAVYRAFTLEEAISIRNEWKSDHSVHKWDKISQKMMKRIGII